MGKLIVQLSIISPILLSIGVLIGIFYYNKLQQAFKLLFAYLVVALFIELLSRYFGFIDVSEFNIFFIPIFGLLEFIVFASLYYFCFFPKSKAIYIVSICVVFFILIDILIIGNIFQVKDYSSYARVVANFTIVCFSLMYLKQHIGHTNTNKSLISLNYVFLIFFVVSILLSSSINFMINERLEIVGYFLIFRIFVFVSFYAFITYQLWQHGKTPKPLQYG